MRARKANALLIEVCKWIPRGWPRSERVEGIFGDVRPVGDRLEGGPCGSPSIR